MKRPVNIPRRIEVGDRISSSEFAQGYTVKGHPTFFYVGPGAPEDESSRADDPARGTAEYTVIEACEKSHDIGSFLIRGLTTTEWFVKAQRPLEGGAVETIIFTQFCTAIFGKLDYWHVIPIVTFHNADPYQPEPVKEIDWRAYRGHDY